MNEMVRPSATPHAAVADGTPTAEDWARFLKPLIFSVTNPPSESDMPRRIGAIAFSLPDVKRSMLTTATQREMLAKCKHWPTAAEVAPFFADALRHQREISEYRNRPLLTAPEAPSERTPEQIEYAKKLAAETKAYLRGIEAPPEMQPVKPRYLSTGQLIEQYRKLAAEGNAAAKLRLAGLEAQLAKEATRG